MTYQRTFAVVLLTSLLLVACIGGSWWRQAVQKRQFANYLNAKTQSLHSHHDVSGFQLFHSQDYTSPSGTYRLRIEPADRDGRGSAQYELTKSGERVWASSRLITLVDAYVTDDGSTIGYGYTEGLVGNHASGYGELQLVILSPTGEFRLNHRLQRTGSHYLHEHPTPTAAGEFVDVGNDRVIFRLGDPDVNRSVETWLAFRLSTGELIQEAEPELTIQQADVSHYPIAFQSVAETELLLVQWLRYESTRSDNEYVSSMGMTLTLLDQNLNVCWKKDVPREFTMDDEADQSQLVDLVRQRGTLLPSKTPRQFEVYYPSTFRRVKYLIDTATENVKVAQSQRRTMRAEEFFGEPEQLKNSENTSWNFLPAVSLQTGIHQNPTRGVFHFSVDDRQRVAYVRNDPVGIQKLVRLNPDGTTSAEILIPGESPDHPKCTCSWVEQDLYFVTREQTDNKNSHEAFWINATSGDVTAVTDFPVSDIGSIAFDLDRSFFVLGDFASSGKLWRFNPSGNLLQPDEEQGSKLSSRLLSPESACFASNKNIAVLDNSRNQVQLFSDSGQLIQTIDLQKAWQRKPNYLSQIQAMGSGFLIHDFHGSPDHIQTDAQGKIIKGWTPKFPSGLKIDCHQMVVSPTNRCWLTDSEAIYRVNESGVVEHVIGADPSSAPLTVIDKSFIDTTGTMTLIDQRTRSVHRFDPDGQRMDRNSNEWELPAGWKPESADQPSQYQQPGTDVWISLDYHAIELRSPDGTIFRSVYQRSDDRWITSPDCIAFAPTGDFAVSETSIIGIYSAAGDPLATVLLPHELGTFVNIALSENSLAVVGGGYLARIERDSKNVRLGPLPDDLRYCQPFFTDSDTQLRLVPPKPSEVARVDLGP